MTTTIAVRNSDGVVIQAGDDLRIDEDYLYIGRIKDLTHNSNNTTLYEVSALPGGFSPGAFTYDGANFAVVAGMEADLLVRGKQTAIDEIVKIMVDKLNRGRTFEGFSIPTDVQFQETARTYAKTLIDAVNAAATLTALGGININSGWLSEDYSVSTFNSFIVLSGSSQILTDGPNLDWDMSLGNIATVTLGGNRVFNAPTNLPLNGCTLYVIQDGIGGREISTWDPLFEFSVGFKPVLSTEPGAKDVFSFISDGTSLVGSYLQGAAST